MSNVISCPARKRRTTGAESLSAFTLTELVVVLAVTAILGLLAGRVWANSRTSTERSLCAQNLRQLMGAWQMYADDYAGSLMPNRNDSSTSLNWVRGWLDDTSNPNNTNLAYLTHSQYAAMGFYIKSPALFRCPADTSSVNINGMMRLRVRSYSMNSYVGVGASAWSSGFQVMTHLSQVTQPERTFVLIEEHYYSINDGSFVVDLAGVGSGTRWVDLPAAYHEAGANLAMADGHVEYWRWSDSRTMPSSIPFPINTATPNNSDVTRLQTVTSYRP